MTQEINSWPVLWTANKEAKRREYQDSLAFGDRRLRQDVHEAIICPLPIANLILQFAGLSPFDLHLGNLAYDARMWGEAWQHYRVAAERDKNGDAMCGMVEFYMFSLGVVRCDAVVASSLLTQAEAEHARDAPFWRGVLLATLGGWERTPKMLEQAMKQWSLCPLQHTIAHALTCFATIQLLNQRHVAHTYDRMLQPFLTVLCDEACLHSRLAEIQ